MKKRTKKLLSISDSTEFAGLNSVPAEMDESFLLLFFKKEGLCLTYFPFAYLGSYKKETKTFIRYVILISQHNSKLALASLIESNESPQL